MPVSTAALPVLPSSASGMRRWVDLQQGHYQGNHPYLRLRSIHVFLLGRTVGLALYLLPTLREILRKKVFLTSPHVYLVLT